MPESASGYDEEYLKVLFTPEEAEFALKMDRGLQTLEEVSESGQASVEKAECRLGCMCRKTDLEPPRQNCGPE